MTALSRESLDTLCGRYLTFRDLVECGETWQNHTASGAEIENVPLQPASVEALRYLCRWVLDPLIAHFGGVTLTYGFSGGALSRRVRHEVGRVSPDLDQHAAHELNSRGNLICGRGGAAVDFKVDGVSSREVARWLIANTPFDRLYFYGDERSVHVSWSEAQTGQVVVMEDRDGRRVPRVVESSSL